MNVWLIKPDQSIDFAAGSIWIEPSKFDDLWSRSNYVWAKRAIQTFWWLWPYLAWDEDEATLNEDYKNDDGGDDDGVDGSYDGDDDDDDDNERGIEDDDDADGNEKG